MKTVLDMTQEEFNQLCDNWWDSLSEEEKKEFAEDMKLLEDVGPTFDEYLNSFPEAYYG